MKYLITKASDDYWYQIKEFNTIEDLMDFIHNKCKDSVVIQKHYLSKGVFAYWEGMKKEDENEILNNIKYQIIIYDAYIE